MRYEYWTMRDEHKTQGAVRDLSRLAENPPHLRPSQFYEMTEREGRVVSSDDRDENGVSTAGRRTTSRSPRAAYTQLELG